MGITERKEREKVEIRAMILDAARELFARDGYERVTMRGVAEAIEYSPTTIYNYFEDKDDLVKALCEEDFTRLLGALSMPLSQVGFCEAACKGAGGKGRWATQGSPPNTTPLPPLRNHDDAFQKPTRVRFPRSAYTTRQQNERRL